MGQVKVFRQLWTWPYTLGCQFCLLFLQKIHYCNNYCFLLHCRQEQLSKCGLDGSVYATIDKVSISWHPLAYCLTFFTIYADVPVYSFIFSTWNYIYFQSHLNIHEEGFAINAKEAFILFTFFFFLSVFSLPLNMWQAPTDKLCSWVCIFFFCFL